VSESAFRAVVAAVLVGALALATVLAVAILNTPAPEPSPRPSQVAHPSPTASQSNPPTAFAGPAFDAPGVVAVGLVARGSSSSLALRLDLVEADEGAIPNGPGSFRVTLLDSAGSGTTVAFVGVPSVFAPGSLGVDVALAAPNVLLLTIEASDPLNVEPITISGLGISATSAAAVGPVAAEAGGFTGSLDRALARTTLPSPGTVTAESPGG
jgi:hypothetical protein